MVKIENEENMKNTKKMAKFSINLVSKLTRLVAFLSTVVQQTQYVNGLREDNITGIGE